MARKLRTEYPDAIYHVMNRGDRQEPIFKDDQDRQRFLSTLGEVCGKTGWQVHAFCLMPNHFHLVVETPRANLAAGMKWLLGVYTGRCNRKHKLCGPLFSGRYRALVKTENRPAFAAGDDDDVEMDGASVAEGNLDARDQPTLPFAVMHTLCQYLGLTRMALR